MQKVLNSYQIHYILAVTGIAAMNEQGGKQKMVMEPISVDRAMEIAKKKGLKPGKVKDTDGIYFTKGKNDRFEIINWDEFKSILSKKRLQVYESGGWMKIMKKQK